MKLEEEELQGIKDRFVPLLTSSLTVSTPNPPAYYDAELIRDGLTYRGKLHRDGGEDGKSRPEDSRGPYTLRRFVIHDEEMRRYEGISFSGGAVALYELLTGETANYRCLEHLLKMYFQSKKVTVNWLDA